MIFGILLSTFVLDESWWARYCPQLYLIPVLAIVILFYLSNTCYKKMGKYIYMCLGVLISALILINDLPFIKWRYKELLSARNIRNEMYIYKETAKDNDIYIEEIGRYGLTYNLKDMGIKYNLVKENDGTMNSSMYNTWIKYRSK